MIRFPQMCNECDKILRELATKDGGLVFCSHLSNSPTSGVFVAAVPHGDRCQLHIIYPCTLSEAKEKAGEMVKELRQIRERSHD